MARKQFSSKFKFQVVLVVLAAEKTPGQIAKEYGIRPNSVGLPKKQFLEKGPELFAEETAQCNSVSGASPTLSSFWARKKSRSYW